MTPSPNSRGEEGLHLAAEIRPHYDRGGEQARLQRGSSQLEFARTQQILRAHLPAPPAEVADVGAGPGAYAFWLAGLGYRVHLVDVVPLHVEQAMETSGGQPSQKLVSAAVGDARRLPFKDRTMDVMLLLGPLYHLVERSDRMQALAEAARVLKPGGIVFAAAISRFASALDGLTRGLIADPEFAAIMMRDLRDGRHHNPRNHPDYFTTAYFHRPDELAGEVTDAGLAHVTTLGIEGPAWVATDFDAMWADPAQREVMLAVARATESEPSIIGMSAHLLAVARKP